MAIRASMYILIDNNLNQAEINRFNNLNDRMIKEHNVMDKRDIE